jgi:hypothetical protein
MTNYTVTGGPMRPGLPTRIEAILPMENVLALINQEVLKTLDANDVKFEQLLSLAYQFVLDTHDMPHDEFLHELRHYDSTVVYANYVKNILSMIPSHYDRKYIFDETVSMVQILIEQLRYPMLKSFINMGYGSKDINTIININCKIDTVLVDAISVKSTIDYLPF